MEALFSEIVTEINHEDGDKKKISKNEKAKRKDDKQKEEEIEEEKEDREMDGENKEVELKGKDGAGKPWKWVPNQVGSQERMMGNRGRSDYYGYNNGYKRNWNNGVPYWRMNNRSRGYYNPRGGYGYGNASGGFGNGGMYNRMGYNNNYGNNGYGYKFK